VFGFADEIGTKLPRVGAPYVGRSDGGRIAYAGKVQIGLTLAEAAGAADAAAAARTEGCPAPAWRELAAAAAAGRSRSLPRG
jgi:hypothetical protein